jgi:Leucine-rich repeat (LRR) protein
LDRKFSLLWPFEAKIIKEIEDKTGRIELASEYNSDSGLFMEGGYVIMLGLPAFWGRKPLSDFPAIFDKIAELSKLRSLNIGSNNLNYFPESICKLERLERLYLNSDKFISKQGSPDNNIKSIPDKIENLRSLKLLDLSGNLLTTLPSTLETLTHLELLAISYNRFSLIPETITKLKNLVHFYGDNNEISSLPESIGNLKALQTLNLDNNSLTPLPESIGNLKALQTLNLDNNPLTSLPESIGSLKALQTLKLDNNLLTSLPESIGNLKALQTLNLDNNPLTSLPESIGNLQSLKILDVTHNPIKRPSEKVIAALERLKKQGCTIYSNSIRNMTLNLSETERFAKYHPNTNTDEYFIAEFPFFDRFQLVAIVYRKNGDQELRIEYLDNEGEVIDGKKVNCIHTVLTTTTLEEIESIPPDISKEEYFRKGGSSAQLPKVQLAPEEHFFALKSWVQGIAELGKDIFYEDSAFPTLSAVFKIVARYDRSFLIEYLSYVERKCQFDGKPHIPSLISSLLPFKEYSQEEFLDYKDLILSMDLPLEVYANILYYYNFKKYFWNDPRYEEVLFKYPHMSLAADPDAVKYSRFKELFANKEYDILDALVNNRAAVELPEYKLLFNNDDLYETLLTTSVARRCPEYYVKFPNYKELLKQYWGHEEEEHEDEDDENDEEDY